MTAVPTTAAAAATSTCPRCNAGNAAMSKFCTSCGSSMTGPAPAMHAPTPHSQPGPQPVAPPRPGINFQRFGMAGGGAAPTSINVSINAADAYEAVMTKVRQDDVEVEREQPASNARFVVNYKDFANTSWMKVKYNGELTVVETAPDQSSVKLSLALNWGSMVPLIISGVAIGILAGMFNYMIMPFMFFIIVGMVAFQIWICTSKIPNKLKDKWQKDLPRVTVTGPAGPSMHSPNVHVPAPAPVTPKPTQPKDTTVAPKVETPEPVDSPTPSTEPAKPSLVDRLKQLNELRQAEAITQEDYDEKKAEILRQL